MNGKGSCKNERFHFCMTLCRTQFYFLFDFMKKQLCEICIMWYHSKALN